MNGNIRILWDSNNRFLRNIFKTKIDKGRFNCLIKFSDSINTRHPSLIVPKINVQKIKPKARKGKYSSIGARNIVPKTNPMVPITIPMLIVDQKGPIMDRLYRTLMS